MTALPTPAEPDDRSAEGYGHDNKPSRQSPRDGTHGLGVHMTDTDTTRTRNVVADTATSTGRRSAARERRLSVRGFDPAGLVSWLATAAASVALSPRHERVNRSADGCGRPRRTKSEVES